MTGLDALQSVPFVSKKGKRFAVLSSDDWECLIDWLETLEDASIALYVGMVVWNRRAIRILVDQADTTPLVGMELLRGFELNMKVRHRGQVTIKSLRSQN